MANVTATIAANRVSPNLLPELVNSGTVRYLVTSADITSQASTGTSDTFTLLLGTTPTDWMVTKAWADVDTAFTNGSTGTLTMQVGTTTTASAFLAPTSILTAGPIVPANGSYSTNVPTSSFGTSSVSIQALFTNGVTSNLTALTAGFLTVCLAIKNPNSIP